MHELIEPYVDRKLIDDLLALEDWAAQSYFLSPNKKLNNPDLLRLIEAASDLMGSEPDVAHRLSLVCATLADQHQFPSTAARAYYLSAQAHAMNAEFDTALGLIELARERHLASGNTYEALRTNIGRMGVLDRLGRYQDALDAGDQVLAYVSALHGNEPAPDAQELSGLAARVHQNRGVCFEQMGRYNDALAAYDVAEQNYRAMNTTDAVESVGDVINNRGVVLLGLGRGREALAAFEAAAQVYSQVNDVIKNAQTLINIGDAYVLIGNYAKALTTFEKARRVFDATAANSYRQELLLDMADVYLALNLHPEALAAYAEADAALSEANMTHLLAHAQWGKGVALMSLMRYEDADRALTQSAQLFTQSGNAPMLSNVLTAQAVLYSVRGQPALALQAAERSLAAASEHDLPLQHVQVHLLLADLHEHDMELAQSHLAQAQQFVDRLDLPRLKYQLVQRLGRMHLQMGNTAEAENLLRNAIDILESLRSTLTSDQLRAAFVQDKTSAYDHLVRLYLNRGGPGDVSRALTTTERARSRALADMLSGIVNPPSFNLDQSEDAERLNMLKSELSATYTQLMGNTTAVAERGTFAELQANALRLEHEINRLHLKSATSSGSDLDLIGSNTIVEEIQSKIYDDTLVLAYYACGDDLFLFAVTQDSQQLVCPIVASGDEPSLSTGKAISKVSRIRQLTQRLTIQWDRFRAGQQFAARHIAQLEKTAQTVLASLYDELMRPVESLMRAQTSTMPIKLVILPFGPLHQVPFHALFDGAHYVIDGCEISYAPSLAVWAICQQRLSKHSNKSLVLGVADELIPAAEVEARTVAQKLFGSRLLINSQATLSAVSEHVGQCDYLHLACHGLFRADNPMFSSLKLHDSWLTAADVMQLDLNGAFVALSACESGRSHATSGDEIMGLTRAFLGAGAASLLVSLWITQDTAAAELMQSFYLNLRGGMRRAEALRAAQMHLKTYNAHPFYWAPFVLIGQQ